MSDPHSHDKNNPDIPTPEFPDTETSGGSSLPNEAVPQNKFNYNAENPNQGLPAETTPPVGEGESDPDQPMTDPASVPKAEAKDRVILNDIDPSMRQVKVALGWDGPEKTGSYDLDLDACVFLLDRNNRVRADNDFIFYNNTTSENGYVLHSGDSPDGKGEGDNEIIDVQLDQLSYDIERLVFTISIHNAEERDQNFKDIHGGFIRVVNRDTGDELVRFPLSRENFETQAFKFAALVRNDTGGWDFELLQEPHEEGLYGIARDYGVYVAEP